MNLASPRSGTTPYVQDVDAQTAKEIAMSTTTERILIAIFLIVAVLFAMRDAHAGKFGKLNNAGFSLGQRI